MAVIETWLKQDLKKPVKVHSFSGNVFSQDNMANLIGVELFDEGQAASVIGNVSANVLRADGATVAVTGTLSGNRASVTLPQAAYAIPGMIAIVIKLSASSVVTTIGAIQAVVFRSSSDTSVDPGTIMPDIQSLINEMESVRNSIPQDYSTLSNQVSTNTGNISTNTGNISTLQTKVAGLEGVATEIVVSNHRLIITDYA